LAGQGAVAATAPAGYIYLRDGTLVRMNGPGSVYDAKDQLIKRPYACVPPTSNTSVSTGAKVTVGFPCPNIYAGYAQLPDSYVPPPPPAPGSCIC
jgi:hypothetical protein